ncbi:cytochrome P450 4V2-like [Tropilaelaps mercedesae]|uniref:Cytochrome P450 4V2-like n=1 Tax=Tropilaelaps mercedesae TaxID=418985 RepID=A0A1V9Y0Q8_9ACAR|nr:cytochrome P450 4V2-like [Tropilaelaps mercedesae]
MQNPKFSKGIRSLAQTYRSEGLFKVYLGIQPTVVVYRADLVEKILSNPHNIEKHSSYRFLYPWLGMSLLTSSGNEWRERRKLLTPAFHFQTLDNYITTINARCADFIEYIDALPQKNDVRLFYEIQKLTLGTIVEMTMGLKMDSLKGESTYSQALAM